MGNQSVGVDISHYQPAIPGGPWLFCVHQATEGTGFTDPTFAGRYPSLRSVAPIVGAYHYGRPLQGNGVSQANRFADTAIAAGFKPGIEAYLAKAAAAEAPLATRKSSQAAIEALAQERLAHSRGAC